MSKHTDAIVDAPTPKFNISRKSLALAGAAVGLTIAGIVAFVRRDSEETDSDDE